MEARIDGFEAILHALARWEFRPAFRDAVPVAVEVLVCIPNDFS